MTIQEQFLQLVEKEWEPSLIPFLKSLTADQKKELTSSLKDLLKEYLEHKQVKQGNSFTFKQKATLVQSRMLNLSAFVCLNRKDFDKHTRWGQVIEKEKLDPILSWYCPEWFSDYVNSFAKHEWLPYTLDYAWVMELSDNGHLLPSDELLVKIIPQMIFERDKNQSLYRPENLTRREITLNKHIWLIFEHENTIYFSDRYLNFGQAKNDGENRWINPLKKLSLEGKIDRNRLLREAILATARNFNKTQSGWYAELFTSLEPTIIELLSLQKELLTVINSPHSKPVNTVLQSFKKILDEEGFAINKFLEAIPLLLSSETKSIVTSTLMILEKLAKKFKERTEEVCVAACQAFIHTEEEIQSRAAKIILKYSTPASQPVQESLSQYRASLLSSTKNILVDFLQYEPEVFLTDDNSNLENDEIIVEKIPLPKVETIDELVFLASQAFDNNKSFHIDLLPASLVNLQEAVAESNLTYFEPALQRAYKMLMNDWPATMGYLDHLLATFFVHYAHELGRQFPKQSKPLQVIHDEYKKKDDELKVKLGKYYSTRILKLETWAKHGHDPIYNIHRNILVAALHKIKQNEKVPLLSTPTHEPCVIDPIELVKRLLAYQQANTMADVFDLQLAISRCNMESLYSEELLNQMAGQLKGEHRRLLKFLFTNDALPEGPFETPYAWMMVGLVKSPGRSYKEFNSFSYASISRDYFTGQFPWRAFDESYTIDRYNFEKKKNEKIPAERKVLRIQFGEKRLNDSTFKNLITKLVGTPKKDTSLLFELIKITTQFLSAECNDIERLLYLFPNNPEPLLAQILSKCLIYNTITSEGDRKIIIRSLEALLNFKIHFGEIGHLFIASCMLSSDKTIRSFAGEIWIQGMHSDRINSILLGEILGKYESIEFAPLKRFTDLLSDNLMQVSTKHNEALETMLFNLLKRLPREPISNLKKLLEIYFELVSSTNGRINGELKEKLIHWESSGSLKKIIKSLESKV